MRTALYFPHTEVRSESAITLGRHLDLLPSHWRSARSQEMSNCAFDLRVAQQKLNGTQVPRPPVNQCGLGATKGVGTE